jgi:hypothetical protein
LLVEVPDALGRAERVAAFLAIVDTAMDVLGMAARTGSTHGMSSTKQARRP